MPDIAIFRSNQFRISEPFIAQQAQTLRRYAPLYLGRRRFGDPPAGARVLSLQDLQTPWKLPLVGWQIISRDPAPYLRLLAGRRPSLIHAHFGTDGVYALSLARRLGVPLVTSFHGFDATLSVPHLLRSPVWANYPLFRRRLAREGDLFLCVSRFIRDQVLAIGFPEARTHLHYTGIDCAAVQPRLDPGEETPMILHVARLVEMKGTCFLIQALHALDPRHDAVRLVIIGDGPLRRGLQRLVRSLGLDARVLFLGALAHREVMAWMRKAAMLVLSSVRAASGHVEGLGMVLLEAAATGLPVIGSDVGGIPEGISHGETGFVVPPRDPRVLARRIGELLDDPALRRRMGVRGRALVEARFEIGRQTDRLEAFYDAALAGKR